MSSFKHFIFISALSMVLAGCALDGTGLNWPNTGYTPPLAEGTIGAASSQSQIAEKLKIALLLPLSGTNAGLGEAMLQSAQLAVSDLNETNIDLVPYDTKGSASGASSAFITALQSNTNLVIGPITTNEVQAIKAMQGAQSLNVLTFSTDWRHTGGNIISLGILPFDQAKRMAHYAVKSGKKSVLIVRQKDLYGDAVAEAFKKTATQLGLTIVADITPDKTSSVKAPYDSVFMPLSGTGLKTALNAIYLSGQKPLLMGTGLWEDSDIKNMSGLNGAVYAAPSQAARMRFEQSYRSTFGVTPPRLASLSYDAVALAIMVGRATSKGQFKPDLSRGQLTNPSGFEGVDGLFRLKADGTNERGLAVHKINNGQAQVIEDAPNSFM